MKVSTILNFGLTFLAITTFLLSPPPLSRAAAKPAKTLHYYKNPAIPLSHIRLDLVYFVPRDVAADVIPNWQDVLKEAAASLKKFYEFQFEGLTTIEFQIHPKPIIGKSNTSVYNGKVTDGGNPNALLAIESELQKSKVFQEKPNQFRVLGIVYEGVGASGSGAKRTFLMAREFLTRKDVKDMYGLTFFGHEFGHTLGIPDISEGEHLETETTVVFLGDDIMGAGRYKPLSRTYVSDEIKKYMYAKNTR